MKKRSKLFFLLFSLMVLVSTFVLYYRTFVLRDYFVLAQISCDPTQEVCFVHHCNKEVEVCQGLPASDTTYYKNIQKMAGRMPQCSGSSEACSEPSCAINEPNCQIALCSEEEASVGGT